MVFFFLTLPIFQISYSTHPTRTEIPELHWYWLTTQFTDLSFDFCEISSVIIITNFGCLHLGSYCPILLQDSKAQQLIQMLCSIRLWFLPFYSSLLPPMLIGVTYMGNPSITPLGVSHFILINSFSFSFFLSPHSFPFSLPPSLPCSCCSCLPFVPLFKFLPQYKL